MTASPDCRTSSVSASVSASRQRFVVHDSFQGAQIFDLETLLKLPDARIPYNGPPIAIPVSFLETGNILVGENGDISVYDSEGLPLGVLGVKAGKHAVNLPACGH
jgi:hypothetical protein